MDDVNETYEQIELLVGKDNAKKLFDFFQGMNIYFPKKIGLSELHNKIYDDLEGGKSYGAVAQKYGYTKSYIRKIENKIYSRRRAERKRAAGGSLWKPGRPLTTADITKALRQEKDIHQNYTGGLFDECD